jgi:hypothetical protein
LARELYELCPTCDGEGAVTISESRDPVACPVCKPLRVVPTGHTIGALDYEQSRRGRDRLLRDWLNSTFRDAANDDARIDAAATILKVGLNQGEASRDVFRKAIAYFVKTLIDPETKDIEILALLQRGYRD